MTAHSERPEMSADGLPATHLAAFRTFLESYRRLMDAIERRQSERELPLNFYDVLVQLSEAPGGRLRMRELASRVMLSRSGLTRLVDRMERDGLVEREPATTDARGVHAVLTQHGLDALVAAVPAHRDDVIELFGSLLTTSEARQLTRILGRIRDRAAQG